MYSSRPPVYTHVAFTQNAKGRGEVRGNINLLQLVTRNPEYSFACVYAKCDSSSVASQEYKC